MNMATQLRAPLDFDPANWFTAWSEHGGIAFVVNDRLFLSRPSTTHPDRDVIASLHDELFYDRRHGDALTAFLVARSFGEMPAQTVALSSGQERALFMAKGFQEAPPLTYPDIVAALRRHPISQSRFGRDACDDPRLVMDMRNGREIGLGLQNRIRAYIERLDREAGI
jgi:hypothetical protein